MRVKMSYTVELDEVPEKLTELLKECSGDLVNASEDLYQMDLESQGNISVLGEIDRVRQMLAKIDDRLQDCYNAYAGYTQVMMEKYNPSSQQEGGHPDSGPQFSEETPPVDPEALEAMRQQLEQLRADDFGGLNDGEG